MNQIEQHLDDIRETLHPDSFRYKTLKSAANFKAGWVDLAEKLSTVLHDNLFDEWGYNTFEQYCRLEIRITKKTAVKLTGVWNFMQEEAKEYLTGTANNELPDFKSVEMLKKIKETEGLTPETYDEFKTTVFEKSADGKEIARQYKEFNNLLSDATEKTNREMIGELTGKLRKKLVKLQAPEHIIMYLKEIEHYAEERDENFE